MLKIQLKRMEWVEIEVEGKMVRVQVQGYNGSKYALGFEADKSIRIKREKQKGKEVPEDTNEANT